MKASGGDSKEAITNRNKFRQVSRVHVRTDIVDFSRNMTTFFPFETRFRSEQEMLMNEKNKEMERWASLVTLLSSILFFVCLFVCFVTRHRYGISTLVSRTSFRGKPVVASPRQMSSVFSR